MKKLKLKIAGGESTHPRNIVWADSVIVLHEDKVSHSTDTFIVANVEPTLSRAYPDRYSFERNCYADADCDDSPSAGWKFVNFCMRIE